MSCCKFAESNLLQEKQQCRYTFRGKTIEVDEDVLYWKCSNCGKFTSLNASNVENVRDTRCMTEECVESYADESVPGTSESLPLEQNQHLWQAPVSSQAPESSSLPRESCIKVQNADKIHKQNAQFSHFGDQCNLRYPVGMNKLNGYHNFRTPFRTNVTDFRFARQKMHTIPLSRRRFLPVDTKPSLTAHRNGAGKHSNEALLPGYSNRNSQPFTNTSPDLQYRTSVHQLNGGFADQEPLSDSVVPETSHGIEGEPHSEHHCSMGYRESLCNHPGMCASSMSQTSDRGQYVRTLTGATSYRVSAPDGAFSYRIPRSANYTTLAHESLRDSTCLKSQGPDHDSYTDITPKQLQRHVGWEQSEPPPPQYYPYEMPNDDGEKDCCSTRVCLDCQTERKEVMKIRPCCCMQHCKGHGKFAKRRYSSLRRTAS